MIKQIVNCLGHYMYVEPTGVLATGLRSVNTSTRCHLLKMSDIHVQTLNTAAWDAGSVLSSAWSHDMTPVPSASRTDLPVPPTHPTIVSQVQSRRHSRADLFATDYPNRSPQGPQWNQPGKPRNVPREMRLTMDALDNAWQDTSNMVSLKHVRMTSDAVTTPISYAGKKHFFGLQTNKPITISENDIRMQQKLEHLIRRTMSNIMWLSLFDTTLHIHIIHIYI